MNLLRFLKRTVFNDEPPYMSISFREMILIVDPKTKAILNFPKGSQVALAGFCGSLWVTSDLSDRDYIIKNGESIEVPGGKIVIQAMTANVPCRLYIKIIAQPMLYH